MFFLHLQSSGESFALRVVQKLKLRLKVFSNHQNSILFFIPENILMGKKVYLIDDNLLAKLGVEAVHGMSVESELSG